MADNTARLQEKLGRATFRAWRRGFREADLVLGPFVEQVGPELDESELDAFEALLDVEDKDLYAWIIGRQSTPQAFDTPMMRRIQGFRFEALSARTDLGA